ncbi:MarR family transcriptional regulator [Microbacterium sp. APC 3898]|jgi:MarR family 2-MHQ and catechol resistance regulon transcriptional repressor|uniref:MarR family transcriptional regulator n=2 Tax=Planococcus TaxID=1372 RepID=A0ABT7ZFQ5_9BACL|nr:MULTISPECIES: MarR family transcriptional regulator [Terrabacteria group]MBF6633549.1 MarR family transcriptional regulator [Planococcus sp. (in: firmicutes)]MBD8013683.1 MarR family transcriptional regulator [Planococcus wigleyi]MDN3425986.1 MarR family transcriptional regulator [Planococcus sp. APC 4016]MDN3437580.1 MarR family transcriptional regulator [Planococcus sp. APC 3900]MDN3497683.1 MarR family transcriptional regulator [Microbacterium sp. APC 3898]
MNEDIKQSLKLFIVLSRAHKAISEQTNQFFQASGVNPTEFAVLELLYHKGKQPLQKIGGKILLASGSITYVIDKLEKRGYINRVNCPSDRRVTYAEISEQGKEFMAQVFPEHEKKLHELTNVLSNEEKEQAIELMKKLGLSIKDLSY